MKRIKQSYKYRYIQKLIFNTDTVQGKAFDIMIMSAIVLSIVLLMMETVQELNDTYEVYFGIAEWVFTIMFTIEYSARLLFSDKPRRYILSFYGLVDLLALAPTYLAMLFMGSSYLMVLRALRLLRVFRVLKLTRYSSESRRLWAALQGSREKVIVFFGGVTVIVVIVGTCMYMIEGGKNGFTSIPRSVYWAIVTITTVGYGDIAPKTILGQTFSAMLMLLGYAIIAVPTGIVTSGLIMGQRKSDSEQCCNCKEMGHDTDAAFCKFCGSKLNSDA